MFQKISCLARFIVVTDKFVPSYLINHQYNQKLNTFLSGFNIKCPKFILKSLAMRGLEKCMRSAEKQVVNLGSAFGRWQGLDTSTWKWVHQCLPQNAACVTSSATVLSGPLPSVCFHAWETTEAYDLEKEWKFMRNRSYFSSTDLHAYNHAKVQSMSH